LLETRKTSEDEDENEDEDELKLIVPDELK